MSRQFPNGTEILLHPSFSPKTEKNRSFIFQDRDLSQAEVAQVIHTTQQQYSKIETGKSDITAEKLILLAQFYNVSADYILGLIREPRPLK